MNTNSTEPTIKEEVKEKVFKENLNSQTQIDVEKIKVEKNDSGVENLKVTIKVENEENNEAGKTNNPVPEVEIKNEDLKRKRVLSEGEASSGFETVSSVDINDGMDGFDLSSEFEDEDYNLIVQIANELAYEQSGGQTGKTYPPKKKKKRKKVKTHANKRESYSGEHLNKHQDGFKTYKEQTKIDNKSTNFDQRYKISSEDEDFGDDKRSSSRDRNRKRDNHLYERSSNIRRNEYGRSMRSRSNENIRSRKSRSQDRSDGNIRSRSPSSKDKKTDRRRNSSDRGNARSNSTNRRRSRSPVSRSFNIWKRLGGRTSPERVKSRERYPLNKERTPFLVELERKLKEADQQKSTKKETKPEQKETQLPEKPSEIPKPPDIPPDIPEINLPPNPPPNPPPKPPPPDTHVPPSPNFYPIQYPSFPTKSVDNLPLVPGPTGLPVHVTITGEQIPHDLDGKRIPVGPNGYYLPLDPTGRLFPHIVSPGNQAVPIHMTEDGVLRLPNSEPVPVGPGHKFPVNIDGSIIVIGADSRPLHPCNNIPREPSVHLLQMMNNESVGHGGTQPLAPQMGYLQTNPFYCGNLFQPAATANGPVENNFNENQEINNSGRNNFRGRNTDVLKCVKIKNNTHGSHSKGDGKQKAFKTDGCHSDSDMVLDSGDSDSASTSKPKQKCKKVAPEEILLTSSDEEILLEKILVKNTGTSIKRIEMTRKEIITKRVQKTIRSLLERKYTPPVAGRFIISRLTNAIINKLPNESPLLRNRIKLAFLTPRWKSFPPKDQSVIQEKNTLEFKFLPKKNSETKENGLMGQEKSDKSTLVKFPVFTFDFAMQCDFTSGVIKDLTAKVTALEAELAWLKNCNANLKNGYKNIESVNQKQTDELKKALQEIQSLKVSVSKQLYQAELLANRKLRLQSWSQVS